MAVSGEYLSETYYRLLGMEITEALYHAYVWLDLNKQRNKQTDKLTQWGMEGVEFDG